MYYEPYLLRLLRTISILQIMLNKPTVWNIGLMNVSICPAKIIKRGLFVLMVLLTIRPYRIFRFVVAVFIFMCVAANG